MESICMAAARQKHALTNQPGGCPGRRNPSVAHSMTLLGRNPAFEDLNPPIFGCTSRASTYNVNGHGFPTHLLTRPSSDAHNKLPTNGSQSWQADKDNPVYTTVGRSYLLVGAP